MRRILWFNFKEPFERLFVGKILDAKQDNIKIEFSIKDIFDSLSKKQRQKFTDWVSDNKELLYGHMFIETELERIQRSLPGLWVSDRVDLSKQKKYVIFDFS